MNVLRALTNTSFGQSEEKHHLDVQTVHQAYFIIRPTSMEHGYKLQTAKRNSLRIATTCLQATPISHLYRETLVLPFKQHLRLRKKKYIYTSTELPTHPSARRPRANRPHTTAAKIYDTNFVSLASSSPLSKNTSLRT